MQEVVFISGFESEGQSLQQSLWGRLTTTIVKAEFLPLLPSLFATAKDKERSLKASFKIMSIIHTGKGVIFLHRDNDTKLSIS